MSNSFDCRKFCSTARKVAKVQKMSLKAKQPNTKPRQFEIMVTFMENHSDLAKGQLKSLDAKQSSHILWKRLEEELNLNGPPSHSYVEWKKIWSDYKNHIKAKLRKNKISLSGTGGGPSKYCTLTALEEQVVVLIKMDEHIDGEPRTSRFGANDCLGERNVNANVTVKEVDEESFPQPDAPPIISTQTPRFLPNEKENLLKLQVQNQIYFQEKTADKLSEICDNLKSLSRYSRKNFEIKEKKLALAKEKFEFKKKKDLEKRKLKVEKLEIKRQMLELDKSKLAQ